MRKKKLVFSTVGALIFSLCAFCTAPAQADFSGTWVLDKAKTRNLPSQLEGYTMVVTQCEQQLTVETKVEGDLRPPAPTLAKAPPGAADFPAVLAEDSPVDPLVVFRVDPAVADSPQEDPAVALPVGSWHLAW